MVLLENKINPKTQKIETNNLYTGNKKEFSACLSYVVGGICFLPVFFGFLLPIGILLFYAFSNYSSLLETDFWIALLNSFKIATLAAFITLCISFLLAYFRRKIAKQKHRLSSYYYHFKLRFTGNSVIYWFHFTHSSIGSVVEFALGWSFWEQRRFSL